MGENTVNGDAKTETTNDKTEVKSVAGEAVNEKKDADVKESAGQNEEEAVEKDDTGNKQEAADDVGDGDKHNADDDEQDEEDDELGEDSKGYKMSFKSSLYIKIMGFKRLPSMAEELKLYYKFFVETLGVSPPLVQIPGPDDVSVFFQLKSVEDRQKVFSQMKGKVYMWRDYKLGVKRVVLKSLSDKKEFGKLPLDEAIKILYPYKELPYSQQLKQKSAIAKHAADLVLPKESLSKSLKTKKNMRSFRIREIVPMIPVEGYDYYASFSIEEDPDTKEILVGLRAMSEDREKTAIVPLDLCLSIPRQMAIVVKSFVDSLPEIGFHPYNPKTREGDILGVTLKMTLSGRFILTVIIPKLETLHFKQLTEDGVEREEGDEAFSMEGEVKVEPVDAETAKAEEVSTEAKPEEKKSDQEESTKEGEEAKTTKEGDEEAKTNEENSASEVTENNSNSQVFRIEETYSYMTKKKMEEAKEKIEKYFDKNGKELSIDSVYLSMVYAGYLSSMLTGKDDTSPAANHILGLAYVPDNYNGLILRVTWERDSYVKSLRSILGLIEAQGKISSSSRVYLISPYRLVGLYLAKKCAHVTMVYYWSRDNMNELQSWAKSVGVNNIEFINAKLQPKRMFPPDNAVTIVWQSTKPSLVHRFLVSGITNFIFVSYWIKDPTHSYVKQHEKQFETVLNKLRISYLYPVDIAPYTERFGMVVFFNGRSGTAPPASSGGIANRLGYPSRPPALIGGGKSGPKGGKPPSLMNKRIPPRSLTDRMDRGRSGGSWGPDPWAGGSQDMQLDQVASGVMQNLQAVSQQMQAVLPSLMQSQMVSPPNHSGGSWGNKRRYDDYDNDSYDRQWGGPSKRRKDGPGNREEITGGGKRGDGSLTNQAWGEHNTSMSGYERRRYLAEPPEWTDSIRQVITYNRPSNNSSSWRSRHSSY
ncbi:uncharacterized protein [Halyomorpha halys]|uniref:uncharacterized protein isoform X2 n=1 Tax=Halyomorpha halys TaxID=286706 RepID=UPI0006D524B5|nr:uncharacterized protein LOC106680729 isoform X2 [Halyomorpha halys]